LSLDYLVLCTLGRGKGFSVDREERLMLPRLTIERIPALFASIYEKACRLVVGRYYRRVAEEIVSEFREGRLLDLGTGPGYLPIEIAKQAPLVTVVGIDLSRPLIRIARRNALKAGLSKRVQFEVGNAAKLGFEDDSFDMVTSTGMLHMLRNPVKVLMECRRVLKPGGEAWIYDPARVSSQIDRKRWKDSFTPLEKRTYPLLALYSRINPPHVYTRKQLASVIESASFMDYEMEKDEGEWRIRLKKQRMMI
jgi:ubiquinone/menaquinone biosynthesis C-methylase UbiE